MINNPLVSIIITTYKRPYFLKKTLDSILAQTYQKLQIIIVDDGSHDSTESTIKNIHDERVLFVSIEHSGYPAIPRNIGLSKASGELIAFCDDDDIWAPTKISEQVEIFLNNPEIELCYTACKFIDDNDAIIPNIDDDKIKKVTTFASQLIKNSVTFSTIMIQRKTVVKDEIKFNENVFFKASEDYIFVNFFIYYYPVYFINKPLIYYRIHKNGISYSQNSSKKLVQYFIRQIVYFNSLFCDKKISLYKLCSLVVFHMCHITKQILYPYVNYIKSIIRVKNV